MRTVLSVAFFITLFLFLMPRVYAQSGQTTGIAVTPVTGNIIACVGTASTIPDIQQFTVSGNSLSANIVAVAPANFQISLNANSGYGSSVTLSQAGGAVANTTVYIRSSASAPEGAISGNVILTSMGTANQAIAVAGVVNTLPTVASVGPQTVNNGDATAAINFTGTANMYTWTNDTPGIGLDAGGSGNIPSFIAVNRTAKLIVATITVTPQSAGLAYITNNISNSISVINTATQQVINTIPLSSGTSPDGVSVSPDGKHVYIGNYGNNTLTALNTSTNSSVTIPSVIAPIGMYVSRDNTRLYVASNSLGLVYVYDVNTNSQIAQISVGRGPIGMISSADDSRLYVANSLDNTISVINTSTNSTINTYSLPANSSPGWIVISPDGGKLYVPDYLSNYVSVINATTGAVITNIAVDKEPGTIAMSPDGNRVYVVNEVAGNVSVINTSNNTVIATVAVGNNPLGISVTSDGSEVYVANNGSGTVSVISTATNKVVAIVPVGSNPASYGNFISPAGCPGTPVTFKITVNPSAAPGITASTADGDILACAGTASTSPNIQQFTVSGSNLIANIAASVPAGFELSLSANSGYSSDITLAQNNGSLGSTVIYVRSSAIAIEGDISGYVTLRSTGATDQLVAVNGIINKIPTVNVVAPSNLVNGETSAQVNFTGTATTFNWVNDTPGIGLTASGTGDIPSFTAINNTSNSITATIIVTPLNRTGCNGVSVKFTITVSPTVVPASLSAEGNLTPLTSIYGTPSGAEKFTVSGTHIVTGILVSPPPGFEVSNDDVKFFPSLTTSGTGSISLVPVYIRLAATTPVGSYNGNILLSTSSAPSVNVVMPVSAVTPAPLTITSDNKTKPYGAVNPVLTVTYNGFVNKDGPEQLTKQPDVTTTATTVSAVGQYPIIANGAVSSNYIFTYINGVLIVAPSLSTISIPNTFTPNGDGINDTWDIKYLDYYPKSTVNIFNRWGQKLFSSIGYPIPWDGTFNGSVLPAGTYYYIIDPKDGQGIFSGWVAIIR